MSPSCFDELQKLNAPPLDIHLFERSHKAVEEFCAGKYRDALEPIRSITYHITQEAAKKWALKPSHEEDKNYLQALADAKRITQAESTAWIRHLGFLSNPLHRDTSKQPDTSRDPNHQNLKKELQFAYERSVWFFKEVRCKDVSKIPPYRTPVASAIASSAVSSSLTGKGGLGDLLTVATSNKKAEDAQKALKDAEDRAKAERIEKEKAQQDAAAKDMEISKQEAENAELRTQLEEALSTIANRVTPADPVAAEPQPNQPASVSAPAPLTILSEWRSQTTTAEYENAVVEAHIISVECDGSVIRLTFADRKGKANTVVDFGPKKNPMSKRQPVLTHLKTHENKRAKFILTWKPGQNVSLASDTMIYEKHLSKWL